MTTTLAVTPPLESRKDQAEPRDNTMVSVVVIVAERPEPLRDFYREFAAPLKASGRPYEFLFIAGSDFAAWCNPVLQLGAEGEPVRVLSVAQSLGEAALLKCALEHCRGQVLVTLPAYRRVQADAVLQLIDRVDAGADVVVARRWPRLDGTINRIQYRALHALVARAAGSNLRDIGCGVRAGRREVLQALPVYGDFARFLPVIAWREGYRVEEIDAAQHPKDIRTRVYSPGIYLRRILDLFGLYFLIRFREKPLRFFGLIGSALASVGAFVLAVLTIQRMGGRALGDRPLLLGAVLLVVLGVQVFALGLVGEIIVHLHADHGRRYRTKRPAIER